MNDSPTAGDGSRPLLAATEVPSARLAAAAAAVLAGFAAVTAAVYGEFPILLRADETASAALHDLGTGNAGWVATMEWVTLLGNRWLLVVGGGLLAAFLLIRRHWATGTFVALTCLAPGLAPLVSGLVGRQRPAPGLTESDGFSYPSGHALTIAVIATMLVLLTWPYLGRRGRAWSIAVAGLAVLLVGATRAGLVVHYPSDVAGGWLLGSGTVLLVYLLVGLAYRKLRPDAAPPPRPLGESPPTPGVR